MKIRKAAIIGGTHGNEYTGVALLRALEQRGLLAEFSSLDVQLLLSNPKAHERNVRFIDFDLNRSFLTSELNNPELSSYEANRAKVIRGLLAPKGGPTTDLIVDVHTTTANMGLTVIVFESNQFNLELAAYLKAQLPNVRVYVIPADSYSGLAEHAFLNSLAPYGCALEIGPIPNGVVRHDILKQALDAVMATLDFAEQANSGVAPKAEELEIYEHVKSIEFPLNDDGKIDGHIHNDIQDNDYRPLVRGAAIFEKLNGDVVLYDEPEELYPVFINEAAYYYKHVAMSLTRKRRVRIADAPVR